MNKKFRDILDIIKDNDKLSGIEKFELKLLLDKADRNVKSYDLGSQIECLKELRRTLNDPDIFKDESIAEYVSGKFTDIINLVMERLSRDKMKIDYLDDEFFPAFDDYRPITFKRVLESFGELKEVNGEIILKPKDPEILERNIDIHSDDGMGYDGKGPNKVFCAYQDDTGDKQISLWI